VIIATRVGLGKVCVNENDTAINQDLRGIIPKQIIQLDNNYLFHWFKSISHLIVAEGKGATVQGVTLPYIKNISIPLPPLPEQQRIVSILDKVFAAIDKAKANAEQNLKNARDVFDSYLKGVFENPNDTWEIKFLSDIGKASMCKRIFKDQTSSNGGIPFFKIGTFGKEPDAFITNELYNSYRINYSFPEKGDILISASGTIGRRVIYNGQPAYFQDSNIVWIRNDEKYVLNGFLYYFYGVCNWRTTKGATIARLYNVNLKQIKISFPKSKIEQQSIVNKLDALRAETQKLEAIYKKKLDCLEELKKSVLQKAFTGELIEDV
jgi:type I restriction enzyme S subunit